MPNPKTLADHARDGTFRSRRHHELLAGPAVPWPTLAAIQGLYNAATSEPERRAIGVEFQRAARMEIVDDELRRELDEILNMPPKPFTSVFGS